ncbi:cytochrome P450 [Phaeosphaeriaceae sp. PMI808]|nr:cytochrome P450 [Phaeosphaeriaceae sp. PMI808]
MSTFAGLSPEAWVAYAIMLIVIAVTGQIVYNAFLHPLPNVPGPFLARPKIRITPNTVIFRDPAAYRDIYNTKANVQKAAFYEAWHKDTHDVNTFSTRDKKEHAKRRKMLNQSFTEKSLRAAQSFIIKHVDQWDVFLVSDVGDDQWSEVMNFAKVSDKLVFDIMGNLCFGTSFDVKELGDNPIKIITYAVVQYMQFLYPLTRSPMLETVLWLKPRGLDSFFKMLTPPHIKNYIDFVDDHVAKRLDLYNAQKNKAEEQRQDMFWFLCDAKDEAGGRAYSDGELHAEANMLIVGGTDTTSVTIAAIMFYITQNPVQYKKLVHEIGPHSLHQIRLSTGLSNTATLNHTLP